MLFRLFLLFVALPLAELALLIWIGQVIGLWPTIAIVVLTGAAGAALARSQGLGVLRRMRAEMAVGRMPVGALQDGLLILVGAIVLLTPGVLTDLAGIVLLLPATRAPIRRWLERKLQRMVQSGQTSFTMIMR
ncbi:MAG TPA: FxsA family protein [Longimicrobiales bacterium]|nr:FxsA family protein [Longimicrobiales bacterium]